MCLTANLAKAQGTAKPQASVWDGMAVAGYVDNGAYVNFGGPCIKLIRKPWAFGFGILPTMRIKRDQGAAGAPGNSAITPTAGFGFTFFYRHLVVQVPFYYNSKTAVSDGKWNPGLGIGFKF
ncbi:hypothetical protein GWC94_13685 [Sediminibacterium sp. WSJ-3]|nr:hypothetical protein [Sediminibacterium soli]